MERCQYLEMTISVKEWFPSPLGEEVMERQSLVEDNSGGRESFHPR